MKKTLAIVLIVAMAALAVFALTACNDKNNDGKITYEIEESTVKVGDVHGTPTITATLPDGTTKDVKNNLVYKQSDVDKLLLNDDKEYTKAGEYTIDVYILEEKNEFFLGKWKINVKITK